MVQSTFRYRFLIFTLLISLISLPPINILTISAQSVDLWWNAYWSNRITLNLTETYGKTRINELTDVFVTFLPQTCSDPQREIRVLFYDGASWIEIPSQVYNVTWRSGYAESCNVVFPVNCSAYSTVTYYIYYNNPLAAVPQYDGLRVIEEIVGDSYNITVKVGETEKNYAKVFWKNLLDLYSNGSLVTWPGGQPGWEFSQINIASLWADAWDTPWFGAGKTLSLASAGALFVDFNYTEAYASDLWGGKYDFNVTTNLFLRIFYQDDLNPVVYFKKTFKIVTNMANYTVKQLAFLDFKLANSSSRAIYQNFTWKDVNGLIKAEGTEKPLSVSMWTIDNPIGWWSYNGSRPDSTDKPAANIGLIPLSVSGTVPGEYALQVVQKIEYDDHHCSQWIKGNYNGVSGDAITTEGYIVIHVPTDVNVDSVMEAKAEQLRNPEPLQISVGEHIILELIDRKPPTFVEIVPALYGQEIFEGQQIKVNVTAIDDDMIFAEKIVPPSGILNVSIYYSTDGAIWNIINMTKTSEENHYTATLPLFESGTKVYYKIVAFDNLLNKAESSIYFYKVSIPPQTILWFVLGFAIGFVISVVMTAAAYYARKKPKT